MAHDASVCGMAENALMVSGNQNECSMARARSNSFCAAGLHDVLNSTLPSFSPGSSCAKATVKVSATSAATSFVFMVFLPYRRKVYAGRRKRWEPRALGQDGERRAPGRTGAHAVPETAVAA